MQCPLQPFMVPHWQIPSELHYTKKTLAAALKAVEKPTPLLTTANLPAHLNLKATPHPAVLAGQVSPQGITPPQLQALTAHLGLMIQPFHQITPIHSFPLTIM